MIQLIDTLLIVKEWLLFLAHPSFAIIMMVIYSAKICILYGSMNRPHERGFE